MNEAWKELKQECAQCRRCGLGETRHHLVFGDGAEDARIMLIGEGGGPRRVSVPEGRVPEKGAEEPRARARVRRAHSGGDL